jgi:HEAT repeat protein
VTPTGAAAASNPAAEIDACLQRLHSPQEKERADALVQLGRLKAERAVGPMIKALKEDASPAVREAAARGLGLVGAPWSRAALEHAAQSDPDGDVRHSAGFAAEVIRSNPR